MLAMDRDPGKVSAPAVQALRHCNEMELLEDCDGEVTAAELAAVGCPSSIIEELLSLCDTNHDGQISFGEFLALAKVEDEISALQDEILYSEIKDVPCGSGGAHLEPACDEAMLTLRPADGTTVQVPLACCWPRMSPSLFVICSRTWTDLHEARCSIYRGSMGSKPWLSLHFCTVEWRAHIVQVRATSTMATRAASLHCTTWPAT